MLRYAFVIAGLLTGAWALPQNAGADSLGMGQSLFQKSQSDFHLNPARTGHTTGRHSLTSVYEHRWPPLLGTGNGYYAGPFSLALYPEFNAGRRHSAGLFYRYSDHGSDLREHEAGLTYAYTIRLAETHSLRGGITGSFIRRHAQDPY